MHSIAHNSKSPFAPLVLSYKRYLHTTFIEFISVLFYLPKEILCSLVCLCIMDPPSLHTA